MTYARECSAELGFDAAGFELLCDTMDDGFNTAFGSWPTAYYLIDQQGALLHIGEGDDGEYSYDVRKFITEVRRASRTHGHVHLQLTTRHDGGGGRP